MEPRAKDAEIVLPRYQLKSMSHPRQKYHSYTRNDLYWERHQYNAVVPDVTHISSDWNKNHGLGLSMFRSFVYLWAKFSFLKFYLLIYLQNIHMLQMAPWNSCSNTCQIWMRYSLGNQFLMIRKWENAERNNLLLTSLVPLQFKDNFAGKRIPILKINGDETYLRNGNAIP